jgi:putative YphP/YqiW family bacilliredoxin
MPYPELMVRPMREDLTRIGVTELTTADDVDRFMSDTSGTAMLVINSVCGCAAGAARPAVAMAIENKARPDRVATVFAGQDAEATQQARSYFPQLPPSSPAIILLRHGELFEYIPRHAIEGRQPDVIANALKQMFEQMNR